jgi:hypothetical protein
MDKSTSRFFLLLSRAFIQPHPPSPAPTVNTRQMSAPSSGSKIPSPQCHHKSDVYQSANARMVALEYVSEMIGSEIIQQADGHFDFLVLFPSIIRVKIWFSIEKRVNYTRNWLFLIGILLMSRELSKVIFALSQHSFICNVQYERKYHGIQSWQQCRTK